MEGRNMAGREGVGRQSMMWGVTDDDGSESKHFCIRVNNSENKKDLKSLKINECTRGSQQQYVFS